MKERFFNLLKGIGVCAILMSGAIMAPIEEANNAKMLQEATANLPYNR